MSPNQVAIPHQFIRLAPQAMGRKNAEERVMQALSECGNTKTKSKLFSEGVTLRDDNGKITHFSLDTLVSETRKTGVVPEIDRLLWRSMDEIGSVFVASNSSKLPPITVGSGTHSSEPLTGPGLSANDMFAQVLDDALHYRNEAIEKSVEGNYLDCFRSYRSHLSACITAIDAYLHRRVWIALNVKPNSFTEEQIAVLQDHIVPLDKKLRTWIPILSGGISLDLTSKSWVDYQSIRTMRNAYVHVSAPAHTLHLEETAKALNLCRFGVGQLLIEVASATKQRPHPSLLRLRHSPTATFIPR